MSCPLTIRSVEIAPPSASHELIAVARTAMAISAATWLYLAISPFAFSNDASARRNLWPYQSLIQDRPSDEQRMFRELQVSLIEAETIRSATGEWPPVSTLAAEGIEPFAPNPALKGPSYTWRLIREGRFINYVGHPRYPTGINAPRPDTRNGEPSLAGAGPGTGSGRARTISWTTKNMTAWSTARFSMSRSGIVPGAPPFRQTSCARRRSRDGSSFTLLPHRHHTPSWLRRPLLDLFRDRPQVHQ